MDHGSAQLRHQVLTDQLDGGRGLLDGCTRRDLQLVVEPVDMGQFLQRQLRAHGLVLMNVSEAAEREPTSSSSVLSSSRVRDGASMKPSHCSAFCAFLFLL